MDHSAVAVSSGCEAGLGYSGIAYFEAQRIGHKDGTEIQNIPPTGSPK